jgi:signal transduction histidine kinase
MAPPSAPLHRDPRLVAELVAVAWEAYSVVLFVAAVVPAALETPWPGLVFCGTLILSAAVAGPLLALGTFGLDLAALVRPLAWLCSITPLLSTSGPRVLVATLVFGLMAGAMRRAIYRSLTNGVAWTIEEGGLGASLRARLRESAVAAGIAGGHVMMLFSVAFLRTPSRVLFQAWLEIVPALALVGTLGFAATVRPATADILAALSGGRRGDRAVMARGLAQAEALPDRLAAVNLGVWFVCVVVAVVYVRPGNAQRGDTLLQIGFGLIFAWGVSFYQRVWHRDTIAPVVQRLRGFLGEPVGAEALTLRARMMRDFGTPLLFTIGLSFFSSIALYRALGSDLPVSEDVSAFAALFASFAMLIIAAGGVVVRAARELSRPMARLAQAADLVAHGRLEAPVPDVAGAVEVVGLGASIERMRVALARTIAELERERAGLEQNVEARTVELRRALDELKHAQAALVHGERMASIGELVSSVAHEIGNPLSAIAGASAPLERLVEDTRAVIQAYRDAEVDLPPERRAALEAVRVERDLDASLDDLAGISRVVQRASDRLMRIVQNLKNFSRASTEPAPTDLKSGLEETLLLLGPRLRHGGIEVERRYQDLPEVICRVGEINQVFMNVLTNAVQALEQAAPKGPTITVEIWREGADAVVAVGDNGPGVPAVLAGRVFDPFFTTKPRGQGTGLGLSISSDIARRHGGTLVLDTGAGHGARFVLRIPLAPPPRASAASAASGPRVEAP